MTTCYVRLTPSTAWARGGRHKGLAEEPLVDLGVTDLDGVRADLSTACVELCMPSQIASTNQHPMSIDTEQSASHGTRVGWGVVARGGCYGWLLWPLSKVHHTARVEWQIRRDLHPR